MGISIDLMDDEWIFSEKWSHFTIQWLGGSDLERLGYPDSQYIPSSMGSQGAP